MAMTAQILNAYDSSNTLVFSLETTIQKLAIRVKNYKDYYYRLASFDPGSHFQTNLPKEKITHFGVVITSKNGFRASLQTVVEYDLNRYIQRYEKGKRDRRDYLWDVLCTAEYYEKIINAMTGTTGEKVTAAIRSFKELDSRVIEIDDLNTLNGIPGVYLLILDEYNACYVGQGQDIKKRIVQHWRKAEGGRIDIFKALDTTRIYALPLSNEEYVLRGNIIECTLLESIPACTTINVIKGGFIYHAVTPNRSLFL